MKKSKLIFALILFYTISNQLFCNFANAQPCDGATPKFFMDLTGKPDSVWISPNIVRAATCCGLTANCIEFNVTLDPNSIGIVLDFASGGVPGGLLEYNNNCSPPTPLGTQMLLSGVGPHRIVFCKPGNNVNEYRITSIPRNINIPDANFKAALVGNSTINTNLDGEIQVTEASNYSGAINVNSLSITSLTGIEEFTQLSILNCDNNSISSLAISANTSLTTLNCSNNPLTTLNVNANTALTSLICSANQLTNIDISANTALTYLDCGNNPLMTSLDVSTNTALTDLTCLGNAITSLNLTTNTSLVSLYCQSNQLTNLSISANTALTYLNCTGNLLTSLNVANNALTQLECANNSLTSLDLSNTAINFLKCNNNNLTNLDLSSSSLLYHLECYNNQITSLNLYSNNALTYLYCFGNQLTYLNIKNGNNTNLTVFDATLNTSLTCIQVDDVVFMNTNFAAGKDAGANYNECCGFIYVPDANFKAALLGNGTINANSDGEIQCGEASAYTGSIVVNGLGITNFTGIEAFTAITDLNCRDNNLTTLNVSNNILLSSLNCGMNDISSIDISNNTALTFFNSDYNNLSNIDVSANTALTYLNVGGNSITSIDLSNNTALNTLFLGNNLFTTLDVSNNTSLDLLDCGNSLLTGLDVSTNTILSTLLCSNSVLTSLNIQNGNNANITNFQAVNNPNLYCIQVDDASYMNTNWSLAKDPSAVYSNTCACTVTATTSSTAASCFGINNGTASATPSGGIPPYSYLWSPGGQTTATASGLAAGNYSVTITDAISCTSVNMATVTQLTSPTFVLSLTVNSLPVSDGKVFLFKRNVINSRMDTIYAVDLSSSSHTFANVFPGNYLIYFKPNSTTFPNTPGRFNGDVVFWENASLILATCANTYTVNINATTLATTSGPGALAGRIVRGSGFGKTDAIGDPIPGVDVSLEQNPGGIMLNQTQTNSNGDYSFTNISYGDYRVKVSIPGTPQSAYYDVTIDSEEPSISNLIYTVDSNNIYPAQTTDVFDIAEKNKNQSFKVIPNPFKYEATLILPKDWTSTNSKTILIITDISGKQVLQSTIVNDHKIIIKREHLEIGLYFVKIQNETKTLTQKIILID